MGQNHRASDSDSLTLGWVDVLLVLAAAALVSLQEPLAAHAVVFGVAAALFVGMLVHRVFAWMEGSERAGGAAAPVREQPRHAARAA